MGHRAIWDDVAVSSTLSQLSDFAERLFWRMLAKSDNWGRLPGDPEKIRLLATPTLQRTTGDIATALQELARVERIDLYTEDGIPVCQILGFEDRQPIAKLKRSRSRFPARSALSLPVPLAPPAAPAPPSAPHLAPSLGDPPPRKLPQKTPAKSLIDKDLKRLTPKSKTTPSHFGPPLSYASREAEAREPARATPDALDTAIREMGISHLGELMPQALADARRRGTTPRVTLVKDTGA